MLTLAPFALGFALICLAILAGPLLGRLRQHRPANDFRPGLRRPRRRAF